MRICREPTLQEKGPPYAPTCLLRKAWVHLLLTSPASAMGCAYTYIFSVTVHHNTIKMWVVTYTLQMDEKALETE